MAHGPRGRSGPHRRQVGMNPSVLSQIQASLSAANQPRPTTPAAVPTTRAPAQQSTPVQTSRPAPAPAAPTTSQRAPVASSSSAPRAATTSAPQPTGMVGAPLPAPPPSSSSSARVSSSIRSSVTSSSARSTSSAARSGVRTVTPSRNPAAAPTTGSSEAQSASTGLSGGGIAGIVIGLIAGIIIIGGVAGWLYRKYKERNYDHHASAWTKMKENDNGLTPYRNDPKINASDEEFYSGMPPAGGMPYNRERDLQPPPQRGFYSDNGMRPDSLAGMDNNLAGYGAGVRSGPYPDPAPVAVAYDANGRPYTPTQQNGQWGYDHHHQQQHNPFDDANRMSPPGSLHSPTSPVHQQNFGGPRQLVGPGQTFPGVAPVPLGRPQPPQSYDDIAAAEMYADDRYADDHMAAPPHMGQLNQQPGNFSPQSFATAEAHHSGSGMYDQRAISPVSFMPASVVYAPAPPLPTMQPMSPLMGPVSLHNDDIPAHQVPSPAVAAAMARAQPYEDDSHRMYDEVARAAGVPSPTVAPPLSPTMQLQQQDLLSAVKPYQHGVPLSPLTEVPTPKSSVTPLMPEGPVPAETSVAQRVTVPTASPSIVAAAAAPRPLPAIPQQQKPSSPPLTATPAPAPSSAPDQGRGRSDSMDDAYGGI
ncbi:hypothetical protein CC85DRAFT_286351 [Cutaneotrichosporon oleaginosum]|uniref:Uncharacterized protein n=1 Tax=Cutaneotrichosporon oleaginosum TaxID=879819 RepID=A0A0J0XKI3_9TREE|nr:uncharacterized protein CC85DRAFT_286351 [Cutaneotrichosporon oleaginosum]KLT41577.1 hypothetical protein CC85DRAFT_286351 [Cutaneotrichosporon oleaginosum]TXT09343.1 hypothetical protein COLE_03277 [Cutaneotrichosporon oleaginosum]